MKKSLAAAVFTFGLIGNAFAACNATPYNAPEELQPACTEEVSVVSDAITTSADKIKEKAEIVSEKQRSADVTRKSAAKEIKSKK